MCMFSTYYCWGAHTQGENVEGERKINTQNQENHPRHRIVFKDSWQLKGIKHKKQTRVVCETKKINCFYAFTFN